MLRLWSHVCYRSLKLHLTGLYSGTYTLSYTIMKVTNVYKISLNFLSQISCQTAKLEFKHAREVLHTLKVR
jgi:hypothetical protein